MTRKRETSKPARKPSKAEGRGRSPAARAAAIEAAVSDLLPPEHHSLGETLVSHASTLSLVHPSDTAAAPLAAARRGRTVQGAQPAPAEPSTDERAPRARKARRPAFAAALAKDKAGEHADDSPAAAPAQSAEPPAPIQTHTASTNPQPPEAAVAQNGNNVASEPPRSATPAAASAAASSKFDASAPPEPANDADALSDAEVLARNMGRFIEQSGKAAAAYLQPREHGDVKANTGEEVVQTMNSLGRVAESWLSNPTKMLQAQAALSTQLFSLWNSSLARFTGSQPQAAPPVADKRFAAPEWRETPFFDFLHQAYLVTTDWAKAMVADAENIDQATREKAAFYLRQISSALSPSNFLATNPELLKETLKEKGENLVRGMKMLAEDIEAGKGDLKIRQTDASKFKVGVDMASTPGKVILRNDLIELIQYTPTTERVLKRPLLIVPPWINKFYVLDLNKEKSLIRWLVSEGVTVFVISWVNPDQRHAQKDWDAYMREGIFAALDGIEKAIGEREVTTAGYCVGGTLLAATLAYMAATGDKRVTSSTFLTTQVDFAEAGDLKVFADEAQIRTIERQMAESGYLAGSRMANAFNMLRPDDLIWSYSVNTYLKGQAPRPFDLLTWNADSTRMSAANHAFYLRNCYLENKLTRGEMVIGGQKLSLGAVTIPIYDLATKEDHIAPARSVFNGTKFFGGPVRYVMAGSGHIAGVVNPPAKAKYQYWSDGRTDGGFEDWVASARETPGTWWLDWIAWLREQAPETVPARQPGAGKLKPICDAPGEYVLVQS